MSWLLQLNRSRKRAESVGGETPKELRRERGQEPWLGGGGGPWVVTAWLTPNSFVVMAWLLILQSDSSSLQ